MPRILLLISFLCLCPTYSLFAHGDLHKQIEQLSKSIKKAPHNANLYLKRGQLYSQHSEFENAKKDLLQARSLNSELVITDLLLAKTYFKNKEPNEALECANVYLSDSPNKVEGLILRASIFQELKQEMAAKNDLEAAFENLKNPNPRHYINIAEASLRVDHSNFEEALKWLKKGQEQFGFDIVLKEKTIEILLKNEQYNRAIAALDEILNRFERKEKWLFQKGTIYEKANDKEAALSSYKATLEALQNLPQRIQGTKKMRELQALAEERVDRLADE